MSHTPNQGIWQSARNAAAFALIGVVGLSVVAAMVNVSLVIGVASGLIFGVFGAGEACVQHLVLRVILYRAGKIPWNYARFLDDAVDRILMQRVGGGYIFIHRLLLEHLAALPLTRPSGQFPKIAD
ncbi:MAG: hypothetical protein SFW36_02905 [Leptolyngbyaceae cyanobacterium bins.59]|nr:hypothetical protein [Leptolyngbyaceae cyanobacterium bins.59]